VGAFENCFSVIQKNLNMSNTSFNSKEIVTFRLKKAIIFTLAFFLLASVSFAQSGEKKTAIGFYIGPNFSNVDITSPNLSAENRSGFQVGGYYRKGGLIYTQIGLEYMKFQTNLVLTDSTGQTSDAVDLNRLQLPLYVGFKVLMFRVYAGPQIYYTLKDPDLNPDFSAIDFKRVGANGTIGAGASFLLFTLDVGHTFGLTNLFNEDFDARAGYTFVNLGVKF